MMRVCGATMERDALSRSRCWCGGMFCGRGGAKLSTQFRKAFHNPLTANTRGDYEELMRQPDLFACEDLREQWRARLDAHRPARVRRSA